MKLKIFTPVDDKPTPEKEVFLRLIPNTRDGGVHLVACDELGVSEPGEYLLSLTSRGLRRCRSVSREIGFQLDTNRRIKMDGEN